MLKACKKSDVFFESIYFHDCNTKAFARIAFIIACYFVVFRNLFLYKGYSACLLHVFGELVVLCLLLIRILTLKLLLNIIYVGSLLVQNINCIDMLDRLELQC